MPLQRTLRRKRRPWTDREVEELRKLLPLGLEEAARRLRRPYQGVALKASRMPLEERHGGARKKPKRGTAPNKALVAKLIREVGKGATLKKACRTLKVQPAKALKALQFYEGQFLSQLLKLEKGLSYRLCPGCGAHFYTFSKSTVCSPACKSRQQRDTDYFDGQRLTAVGMVEGVCQLCLKHVKRGLSAHHLIGKGNDPGNTLMVALCVGCHDLVTQLSLRTFLEDTAGWERLISMVMTRRQVRLPTFTSVATIKADVSLRSLTFRQYCNEDGIDPRDLAMVVE